MRQGFDAQRWRDEGDRFADMAARHARLLYRVAYSLLRNAHDAEDAVQECLLKLHRNGGWQAAESEEAFLTRAVWRCALDRLPKRKFVEVEDGDSYVAPVSNPEEDAVRGAQEEHLHRLIDALPLELREPLLLSGFEELTSVEIAAVLDIPEGTVRTRLKRAREELRRRWFASQKKGPGNGTRL